MLDNLQKRIFLNVGPSLDASLEPLVQRRSFASLSLFYGHYFGGNSSEMAQLVPFPYSTSLDYIRMSMSTFSFPM